MRRAPAPILALVTVTAIWGYTFVPVQKAVAVYPLVAFLALAYALQTAGLELTTVTSTGFITGLYVVFTPLLALAAFRTPVPAPVWVGVVFALAGLLLLSGARRGDVVRARRHRRLRGRARVPRVDLGAVPDDRGARSARLHARGALRRPLR